TPGCVDRRPGQPAGGARGRHHRGPGQRVLASQGEGAGQPTGGLAGPLTFSSARRSLSTYAPSMFTMLTRSVGIAPGREPDRDPGGTLVAHRPLRCAGGIDRRVHRRPDGHGWWGADDADPGPAVPDPAAG